MSNDKLKPCPYVFLTDNHVPVEVIIDKEDIGRIKPYVWKKYPSCRYVQASIDGETISLSRFIVGAAKGSCVDHINGDRLDNRKSNLRICSHAANTKNRKPNKKGESAYKGVVVLSDGRYRAKIDCDGVRYNLGVYPYERDAVVAYNAAAKVLHGEFAYMNELPSKKQ